MKMFDRQPLMPPEREAVIDEIDDAKSAASSMPEPGDELARQVRMWRERLISDDAVETGSNRPGRPQQPVSQEQIAHEIGYTVGWYRRLELGKQQNYSDDFLEKIATSLHLEGNERSLLFLLASGRKPPAPRRAPKT
ncbi:helix-turn-helix domain-containing protein, partial [Winogradskya humida]